MDRRNKSEDLVTQTKLPFSSGNKKVLEESKNNFLLDCSLNPEHKNFKNNLFELNSLMEENPNINKNFIRTIFNKFHDFTMKLMYQNKQLYTEIQILKQKPDTPNKGGNINSNTNNEMNSNISADFTLKRNDGLFENENKVLKVFIEDELECFNQIIIELNSQFNEMQSKEESLRKQIIEKCDEITKLNNEVEDLKKNRIQLITELQNFTLKINDVKKETILSKSLYKSGLNNKEKFGEMEELDEEIRFHSVNIVNDDMGQLVNSENKKLIDENNQLKEILSKMKETAFKTENDINQIMNEYENLENFKKFILTNFKTISENNKDFKQRLDKMSDKFNKIEFKLEND